MPSVTRVNPVSRRRSRTITDIERAAICRYRRRHPSVGSAAVVVWARDELGITVSRRTVCRLMKKDREVCSRNPLKILYNMLDEYTHGPTYKDMHVERHIENNSTFRSPSSRETNGKINDINSEGEISLGAVKKYLQAWVTYLQDTNHPEKDLLVSIAEKHLQELEIESINNKLQTTIQKHDLERPILRFVSIQSMG